MKFAISRGHPIRADVPLISRIFRRLGAPGASSVPSQNKYQSVSNLSEQLALVEQLYRDAHATALAEQVRRSWLHAVALELARPAIGWRGWLPYILWQRRLERRLSRAGIFDGADYSSRYPDVSAARLSPIYHYLAHGMSEGRDGGERALRSVDTSPDVDAIPAILASGLFDATWYKSRYREKGTDEDLVKDFLQTSSVDVLRQPGPLFSGAYYSLENPDTKGINPLVHYVRYGMRDGRRAFQPSVADAFMAQSSGERLPTIRDFLKPGCPVLVLHWEDGNFFFTDIAKYVGEVLADAGHHVQISQDHRHLNLDTMEIIVVAPHEYCVHGPGVEFSAEIASRVVHVNLEQWHTSWFSLALDKMLISRKALDINPRSAQGLARLGIEAGFLPLVPRPGGVFDYRCQPPSQQLTRLRAVQPLTYPKHVLERPYDILFVGSANRRRARALSELANTLADYNCFLHAPRLHGPVTPDNANMISGSDLAQIAQNAKILLNIHQGESHYFEWHRLVVSGIAQGCVPLSEPCSDIGMVTPGEHYIEATIAEMPERITWLLNTSAGQREIERLHKNGRKLMANLNKFF